MQVLLITRRGPDIPGAGEELTQLAAALHAAHHQVLGLFLLGPGAAWAQPVLPKSAAKLRAELLNSAQRGKFQLTVCGRAAARHGVDINQIQPPFVPGGYFQLLRLMQQAERVIEI